MKKRYQDTTTQNLKRQLKKFTKLNKKSKIKIYFDESKKGIKGNDKGQ